MLYNFDPRTLTLTLFEALGGRFLASKLALPKKVKVKVAVIATLSAAAGAAGATGAAAVGAVSVC